MMNKKPKTINFAYTNNMHKVVYIKWHVRDC